MVTIKKKIVGTKTYYYLELSYREKNTVKKKEQYLGTELPANIELLKQEFLNAHYKERWYATLETIKQRYNDELKAMPVSAREKELATFIVKFTYDTQRIEGSTLTLKETANLLERGISPNKPVKDIQEAEAHRRLFHEVINHEKNLSLNDVLYWHKKLFTNTKPDIAGRIRNHGVRISGSKFLPPTPIEVEPLLREFFSWYNQNKDKIHPVELAALVHLRFVTIHPFSDGNGRISRLMMNYTLHKHHYPLLDIAYENRNSYYNALERAQTKEQAHIFIQWFIKRYVKEHNKSTKK